MDMEMEGGECENENEPNKPEWLDVNTLVCLACMRVCEYPLSF